MSLITDCRVCVQDSYGSVNDAVESQTIIAGRGELRLVTQIYAGALH